MSYNVVICTGPIPARDARAWQAVNEAEASRVKGDPPEAFRKLHDLLTARYPCISTLSDDKVDDGVWSDGPLWNNFGHHTAMLGIVYSRVDEVLPFLVKTANGLGLTVFDEAGPSIYRARTGWSWIFKPLFRVEEFDELLAQDKKLKGHTPTKAKSRNKP